MILRRRHGAAGAGPRRRAGFTLIELLVAAAIAALLMMTAIPFVRDVRKTPLVRAVNAVVDACRQARLKAILTDRPMQVVIYDNGGAIGVEPAPQFRPETPGDIGRETGLVEAPVDAEPKPALFEARLDDEVAFRQLLVNGRNLMAEQAIAVRFYPNGTCDALDAELQWLRREARRISLDIMTGQPLVEAIP